MPEKKPRILLIEDQRFWLESVENTFKRESANYEIVWVKNSEEALEKLKAEEFDAVILDIILPIHLTEEPVNEGIELCRRIKKGWPDLPIIALTIRPTEVAKEEIMAAGARYYITKPWDPHDLCGNLKKVVSTKGNNPYAKTKT